MTERFNCQLARTAYAFLVPSVVYYLLIWIYPLYRNMFISLHESNLMGTSSLVWFRNYLQLLRDPHFWNALKNTFVYTVIVLPSTLAGALLLALLLNRIKEGRTFFRTIIFVSTSFSLVAVSVVFKIFFNTEFGIVNMFLKNTLHFSGFEWLTNQRIAIVTVAITGIWKSIGWYTMIYLAALQNSDTSLEEAATIDGAGSARILFRIVIPQLRPIITFTAIIATIGYLQIFPQVMILTKGGPARSTETIVYYIYKAAFRSFDYGYASSMAVVLLMIITILTIIQSKLLRLTK